MFSLSDMESIKQTFFQEADELAESMEFSLLTLSNDPADSEAINAVFRAAHTIKGSAGLIAFERVVAFTHLLESMLVYVRDNQWKINSETIALLLSCKDHMLRLIDVEAHPDTGLTAEETRHGVQLSGQLQEIIAQVNSAKGSVVSLLEEKSSTSIVDNNCWHISLRFSCTTFADGFDPLSFMSYLNSLGELHQVIVVASDIPAGDTFEPEVCYLGFEVALRSNVEKTVIEDAFIFLRDNANVTILPPRSQLDAYVALIEKLPNDNRLRLGEMLVSVGAITRKELNEVLNLQNFNILVRESINQPNERAPLGELLVASNLVQKEIVESALNRQQNIRKKDASSIRVDAEKLDVLINLVGELVIASAGASLAASIRNDESLRETVATVSRLVEQVRDSSLNLRMVAIGTTLNRFQRLVHDIGNELNKNIELVITGGDTELDKSMVEKLSDPLVHLIRNAIDHGIESSDVRIQNNKPPQARVEINAFHESNNVVIEVIDDGAGMNREKILAKAKERNLIKTDQPLSDSEIWTLIFEPGFSTADAITNISGRGVGMDVVRRNIDALHGNISIQSTPGKGSRISIRLPLTLAIIDGFLVSSGSSQFVVPLGSVIECIEGSRHQGCMNLRDSALPLIDLQDFFGESRQTQGRRNIVVVQAGSSRAGLIVDQLHGEIQAVIKPLSTLFAHVQGVSGSTIQGNGEVALILDINGLIKHAEQLQRSQHQSRQPHSIC